MSNEQYFWTFEISPELFSIENGKKRYIVISARYGLYSKKEAEIICEFLRNNLGKIMIYQRERENR